MSLRITQQMLDELAKGSACFLAMEDGRIAVVVSHIMPAQQAAAWTQDGNHMARQHMPSAPNSGKE